MTSPEIRTHVLLGISDSHESRHVRLRNYRAVEGIIELACGFRFLRVLEAIIQIQSPQNLYFYVSLLTSRAIFLFIINSAAPLEIKRLCSLVQGWSLKQLFVKRNTTELTSRKESVN